MIVVQKKKANNKGACMRYISVMNE